MGFLRLPAALCTGHFIPIGAFTEKITKYAATTHIRHKAHLPQPVHRLTGDISCSAPDALPGHGHMIPLENTEKMARPSLHERCYLSIARRPGPDASCCWRPGYGRVTVHFIVYVPEPPAGVPRILQIQSVNCHKTAGFQPWPVRGRWILRPHPLPPLRADPP
jgi:hypothetical protein